MKRITILQLCLFFFSVSGVFGQVAKDYEVATWHDFKTAAVTYTFDDNTSNQLPVAIPLFDQYNFKVTLYPVINWVSDWSGLKKAAENGHEIGSHTVSHPVLSTLSVENQEKELQQSQSAINSNIPDASCVTIAYPNCVTGDLATVQKYYIAGRICSGAIVPPTPSDFYNISSIAAGSQSSVKLARDFNDKVTLAKVSNGWCVFLLHGIDDDKGYSPLASTELAAHLKFMNDNSQDYWVATFGNVVKYIRERNAVSITETVLNSDSLKLLVKDNLDHSIYNLPVTLRRKLPEGWTSVHVYAGKKQIKSEISLIGNGKYVVFDAVPDQDDIYLVKMD